MVSLRPATKHRSCQVTSKAHDREVQTFMQTKEVGVQCQLITQDKVIIDEIDSAEESDDEYDPDWVPGDQPVDHDDEDDLCQESIAM